MERKEALYEGKAKIIYATENSDEYLVYYKDDNRVGPAGSILMIVGGIFTFNDFLGWIGAILSIIGGSLYLASLKRFQA